MSGLIGRHAERARLEGALQAARLGEGSIVLMSGEAGVGKTRLAGDLQAAAERSTAEGDKDDSGVRWIRSYVLGEESGEVGTVCIYEADSPEALRAHAKASQMAADEVIPVL